MDFELSEDQVALRDAARSLLAGLSSTSRVREVVSSQSHLDRELWQAMAEQGWLAVEGSEADGGLGLGMVEVAVLCEEVGRRVAPVPFLGTVLAAKALATRSDRDDPSASQLGGKDPEEWVGRLRQGEAIGAVAWSKDPRSIEATTAPNGGWQLTGKSDLVVYGPEADVVVVFAHTGQGASVFAVTQDHASRPTPEPAMDVTRCVSWLGFEQRPALRLGGTEAAEALVERAATAICAEMLGSATRVLEMTVDYAKDRVQFGRPIGSFQAVKHRCADMLVDTEGMRSSAYFAAWAVGSDDPEAPSAASAAKVWCSDAASRVMASGLQVHGGIGFTWEHDLHLYLKRSQLDQTSFGNAVFHRERLANILRPRAEAGLPVL